MAGRVVRLIATGAALAAVLTGLARGWDVWTVLKRMVIGYLSLYATGALLVAFARIAMTQDPEEATETPKLPEAAQGTDGTNAAV